MLNFKRLTTWYFNRRALPYWVILFLDCAIVLLSSLVVYALNNGTLHTLQNFLPLLGTFSFYLVFCIVGFRLFHTYAGFIRYSSFIDLRRVGNAMLTGLALALPVRHVLQGCTWLMPLRLRDLVLGAMLATMLMWMVRVVVKYLFDSATRRSGSSRVFIYGVKEGGVSLARSIHDQTVSPYALAGFVSDERPLPSNLRLLGKRVYPNDEGLVRAMEKRGATVLLVSPLRNEAIRNNPEMVSRLSDAGIKIMMLPAAQEWDGKSDLTAGQLHEVDIEDLLPRDKIEIDLQSVAAQLAGKTLLITGAAGSIGSEIVRQAAKFGPRKLVLIDQAETPLHDVRLYMARNFPALEAHTVVSDICVHHRMEELFALHRPDYVFHAAAYKHVPMMEDNPGESIRNNVEGTRIIADLAVKYGTAKFVMVSTDKAVNPTNVMGCSKRICEIYVQSLDKALKDGRVPGRTQFVTTRFGNVLGSNGSVIPLFKEQIRQGGPVTVTHPEIIRFFMLIPEACKLVLEAGTKGRGGEIFVFDMGKPVKIVDLAHRMIQLSGAKGIEIKFTGLRDGEKLYEEVLNEKETTLPAFHPKIQIAQVREYDYAEVCRTVAGLVAASHSETDMQVVARMKALVPEFKSRHSKYEALDR